MAIGAVGIQSLFTYQPAQSGIGAVNAAPAAPASGSGNQNSVVAEALASAYSTLASTSNGFLGASSVLPSLANGLYDLSTANGTTTPSISDVTSVFATSGQGAPTASLFSNGQSGAGSSGLLAAVNLDATMALAAYSYRASGQSLGTSATPASAATTQPTTVQSAIQAALAATTSGTLSLLG